MAELRNMILTVGHDLAALMPPLRADVSLMAIATYC